MDPKTTPTNTSKAASAEFSAEELAAASNAIVAVTMFYSKALGEALGELNRELKKGDPVKIANMLAENFAQSTGELKAKIEQQAYELEGIATEVNHAASTLGATLAHSTWSTQLDQLSNRLCQRAAALRELAK